MDGMNSKRTVNLVVVGVGGQGLITIGRVLGNAAIKRGVGILVSEIHGLAQRGGSVIVHVRIGSPNSPLVPVGGAHAVLGLELMETIRYLNYANRDTLIIVNRRTIRPSLPKVRVIPIEDTIKKLRDYGLKVLDIDAYNLAMKAGGAVSENMVMLGALIGSNILEGLIDLNDVEYAIKNTMHPRWHEINIKALKLGYEEAKKNLHTTKL